MERKKQELDLSQLEKKGGGGRQSGDHYRETHRVSMSKICPLQTEILPGSTYSSTIVTPKPFAIGAARMKDSVQMPRMHIFARNFDGLALKCRE